VSRAWIASRAKAPAAIVTVSGPALIIRRNQIMKAVILDVQKSEVRLLDLGNAATYLGISRSAVRQLVDSGQLSRVLLPSPRRPHETLDRFLVDKAEIDAFIERNKERERP
jgi:predicted DNA-binding transcriptional regulator AlpA